MLLILLSTFGLILAVLALFATELGVDSRDNFEDPRRSTYPVGIR